MNNYFLQIIQNKFVYIPALLWLSIQIIKFIYELIKTKKINFKRLMGAGGIISSHSAVVMALTTLIGKECGFDSANFAISLIFSLVVMYDAAGVRRAAGKQATLLNKIVSTSNLSGIEVQEKLVEVLGHTPIQVILGAVIGIIVGVIF